MTDHNEQFAMGLLDGDVLTRMRQLELIARHVVEGFLTGRHRSPYKGFSVEFAEHREYSPGDEIRNIDWRVYARSDRHYVKQFEEETNLRAYLLVDASGSMAYRGDQAADGLSKFEYVRRAAAVLAHLMLHQSDAVGLVTFDREIRRYIPPRATAAHQQVLLEELVKTEPGGETSLAGIFHDLADRIRRRALVIILSDLFDDDEALLQALHHFRHKRHEVMLVQVMAREELTFPFRGWFQFQDLESDNHKAMLDPASIRRSYLTHLRGFLERLERRCGQMEIDYLQCPTTVPYETALTDYLARRAKRVK